MYLTRLEQACLTNPAAAGFHCSASTTVLPKPMLKLDQRPARNSRIRARTSSVSHGDVEDALALRRGPRPWDDEALATPRSVKRAMWNWQLPSILSPLVEVVPGGLESTNGGASTDAMPQIGCRPAKTARMPGSALGATAVAIARDDPRVALGHCDRA
jgi:hypothetical protein